MDRQRVVVVGEEVNLTSEVQSYEALRADNRPIQLRHERLKGVIVDPDVSPHRRDVEPSGNVGLAVAAAFFEQRATRGMGNRGNRPIPTFDRATAEGRQAEMAYLDGLDETELHTYDPGHRYVTANPATTPEREAHLAKQLAEINAAVTDA